MTQDLEDALLEQQLGGKQVTLEHLNWQKMFMILATGS